MSVDILTVSVREQKTMTIDSQLFLFRERPPKLGSVKHRSGQFTDPSVLPGKRAWFFSASGFFVASSVDKKSTLVQILKKPWQCSRSMIRTITSRDLAGPVFPLTEFQHRAAVLYRQGWYRIGEFVIAGDGCL